MIIVTLVATLAASMVWQQWRAVQVETAERAREQSAWILSGALDWARLILREDARSAGGTGAVDHLGEPWAVPLAEARLSTFLAADKNATDDAPDAFLSGTISDAQARFNLTNLVKAGKVDPLALAALVRLCDAVGASADAANRIATGLLSATPSGALEPTAPLLPRSVGQLDWLGVDPATTRLLAPYVVLLPAPTKVNVNTAPREVLAAVVNGLDLASAERLVQLRQHTPFRSAADIARQVTQVKAEDLAAAPLDVGSSYFEVRGRLRLGDRVLEQTSLVMRRGIEVTVVQRQRVSSRDQPGS